MRTTREQNDAGERPKNPAIKFFEWAGGEGKLKWYDKETKTTNYIDLPFTFLVLDQLQTVKGFSEELHSGFYANEVRRNSDTITLMTKNGVHTVGKWKEDLKPIDGTLFTKSVYIAFFDEAKTLQIGNLQLNGAALGGLSDGMIDLNLKEHKANSKVKILSDEFLWSVGWFNFTKKNLDIDDIAVQLYDKVFDKRGKVEFYRPVFRRYENISEETQNKALELGDILQDYLVEYFAWQKALQGLETPANDTSDDIPQGKAQAAPEKRDFGAEIDDYDEDLDDSVPF